MERLQIDLRCAGVEQGELQRHAPELRAARRALYRDPEGEFLHVPHRTALLREIRAYCRARPTHVTDVVQLGIGGSSLGAQALCRALLPTRHNERVRPGSRHCGPAGAGGRNSSTSS
jgi:glucose-6-phosphate isomerase